MKGVTFLVGVFLLVGLVVAQRTSPVRVGVIGAGMAGGSMSYYLRKAMGTQVEIDVFERNDYIGGRLKHAGLNFFFFFFFFLSKPQTSRCRGGSLRFGRGCLEFCQRIHDGVAGRIEHPTC